MHANYQGSRDLSRALCTLVLFLLPCALFADTPPPDPARYNGEVGGILDREAAQPPPQGGTLFIGSSNIRKWPILAAFPDLALINQGFGGSQVTDSTFFFDRLVLPFHPKLIVFHAGGNDLAAGRTPSEVAADVEEFVKKAHAELPDTKVIYVGLIPAPIRWQMEDKFHETTRLIAAALRHDRKVTFVDPEKLLLSPEGTIRPEIYESDHLHLNAQGYEIMTKMIAPYIKKGLRR